MAVTQREDTGQRGLVVTVHVAKPAHAFVADPPVELDRVYQSLDTIARSLGPNGANQAGALNQLLRSSSGLVMLAVAAGLMCVGALWLRSIVKVRF